MAVIRDKNSGKILGTFFERFSIADQLNTIDNIVLVDDDINKRVISIPTPNSSTYLHNYFSNPKSLWFINCDLSNKTMLFFNNFKTLEYIRFDNCKFNNSLEYMFCFCENLETIDRIEEWDVSNVTSLYRTFGYCNKIKSLNIKDWDVSNVTSLRETFIDCNSLTELDLSGWDVNNVTNFSDICNDCDNLRYLNASNWKKSNWTINDLFEFFFGLEGCPLEVVDISNWDITNLDNLNIPMAYHTTIECLVIDGWDFSNITGYITLFYMFHSKLKEVRGKFKGLRTNINLYNTVITNADNFFDALMEVEETKVLTLPSTCSYTEEQLTEATSKGWTVSIY